MFFFHFQFLFFFSPAKSERESSRDAGGADLKRRRCDAGWDDGTAVQRTAAVAGFDGEVLAVHDWAGQLVVFTAADSSTGSTVKHGGRAFTVGEWVVVIWFRHGLGKPAVTGIDGDYGLVVWFEVK